jgi:hypothetical protein
MSTDMAINVEIRLDTNENNAASTRMYTVLGFSSLPRRRNGRQVFFRRNQHNPA